MKVVLNRREHARRLFYHRCRQWGVRPFGWATDEFALLDHDGVNGFGSVWWNSKRRRFWVRPTIWTHRSILDPSAIFPDKEESEYCNFNGLGLVLNADFDSEGFESFEQFCTQGHTYNLRQKTNAR